jgi:hypothetical protein
METRVCTNCGLEQPLTEYNYKNKRKGVRHVHCRGCTREQIREHYQANRLVYIAKAKRRKKAVIAQQRERITRYLKAHPCGDCGEADPRCLDFDHVRGEKRAAISEMIGNFSWEQIENELAKCEVRCANCHRKRTAERRASKLWPFVLALAIQ